MKISLTKLFARYNDALADIEYLEIEMVITVRSYWKKLN
jgi:hypothetical protein